MNNLTFVISVVGTKSYYVKRSKTMTILEYSPEELIREMDLKNILVDYHYEVNQEYQNFDDIEDEEEMIAYITEMLDEAYGEDEQYNPLVAGILYHMVKDDVIEEIYIRDENAKELEEERKEIH